MDPIAQLTAAEQIRTLKARYFRFVDGNDWTRLALLFAPDIVFDRRYGGAVPGPWTGGWQVPPLPVPALVRGREAVVQMVRNAVERLRTVHQGHSPEVTVVSSTAATGIWGMSDELRDRSDRLVLAGTGYYHDIYQQLAHGWVIRATRLSRLSIRRGDGVRD